MKKAVILLSGSLAQKYGRRHERWLDTATVSEAMNSLKNTLEGFSETVLEMSEAGTEFAVFKNRANITEKELGSGGLEEVRIVPVIAGSKSGGLMGILSTVVGAVLIGVGVITGQPWLMVMGGTMLLGGVMSMLSPQPKQPKLGDEEGNQASYGFGGAVSTTASGNNVPVLFGKRLVGGAYISASIINYDTAL